MGKILIDLRNTREEAISVAEPKFIEDEAIFLPTKEAEHQQKIHVRNEDGRRSSSTSEKSLDQEDEDDRETKYRLDPKCVLALISMKFYFSSIIYMQSYATNALNCRYANVRTPERHVRTRLYFTSVCWGILLLHTLFLLELSMTLPAFSAPGISYTLLNECPSLLQFGRMSTRGR